MNPSTNSTGFTAIAAMGSGGAGAITTGSLLLEAAGRSGWYGLLTRSVGPQIRGGEALAMVRLSPTPVTGHGDRFNLLIALDWRNASRFIDEIPLDPNSLIIADNDGGQPLAAMTDSGARLVELPFTELADDIPGARPNIVALGTAAGLLGLSLDHLETAVNKALGRKGLSPENGKAALVAGHGLASAIADPPKLDSPKPRNGSHWQITGNEAAALGALRGGVRFAAVYPITPATDLSEWLAPRLQKMGGHLIQAEDEIASINMVLGASYGGVPALTATSGPGLALMSETIGLGVAAEVPAVIVNVMRGGPSTGIPTKSEQSDLNIALYGLHGDAPHLVLAPQSVDDCIYTTHWAVQLTEALQCPAIVLSDQFMGQAISVCDPPAAAPLNTSRLIAEGVDSYDRYALTDSGISPMAIPGTPGLQYTADGLEHNPHGTPSSKASDHVTQLDKRRDKLLNFDYGDAWADIEGEGPVLILTWGSTAASVREAASRAREAGVAVKVIALRLLLPARTDQLNAALSQAERVLIVEQSHSDQFYGYLRTHYTLPAAVDVLSQPGPLPIRPQDILNRLLQRH